MNISELPAGIRRIFLDAAGTLPAFAIDTPRCKALVSVQGAQVLAFAATGQLPLLWLSAGAVFAPGKAIRGGIPLCFPWFGAHADPQKPAHGFARNRLWDLQHAACTDGVVTLVLALVDDAHTHALWPHRFAARMTIVMGDELALELALQNRGDTGFSCEFALHSYFPVSDVRAVHVTGLAGKSFGDKLQPSLPAQTDLSSALRFGAETDRVYTQVDASLRLHDPQAGSDICMDAGACRSVIVWNPWAEKCATFTDMAADAWQQMLCVEHGNVGVDALQLAAGKTRVFNLRLYRQPAGAG